MALVAFESFDHYGTAPADILNRRGGGLQWNAVQPGSYGFVSPGRTGVGAAYAIGAGNYSSLIGALTVPLAAGFVGVGLKLDGSAGIFGRSAPSIVFRDLASGEPQLIVDFAYDAATMTVYRGNRATLLGTTANNAYTVGAWTFFEFGIRIDHASGTLEIRVDSQPVFAFAGDTRAAGAGTTFDGIEFYIGQLAATPNVLTIDDLYIADTAPVAGLFTMDTFLGDVRVVTLHPVADYGTPGWTPLALTNWQEIAEVHADGDASYNASASVGAADRFSFAALAGTVSNVLAVQVTGAYRKDDAGARTITQSVSSDGTEVGGPAHAIPTTYVYCSDLFPADPATGTAWTAAAVNTLRAGYTLSS
jgi:hypothetical protein